MADAWQRYADTNGLIMPDAATFYSKPVDGKKILSTDQSWARIALSGEHL